MLEGFFATYGTGEEIFRAMIHEKRFLYQQLDLSIEQQEKIELIITSNSLQFPIYIILLITTAGIIIIPAVNMPASMKRSLDFDGAAVFGSTLQNYLFLGCK